LNPLKAGLRRAFTSKPDVDNLVKFVLDGMNKLVNKLVCEDDSQVVKLTACKLFDSEGACDGRTVIQVSKFT
jgi:Holliday junction resolvase RusA-like endonuclease